MGIEVKSILVPPSLKDGMRILIERQWPRRVDKPSAEVDLWLPELAFSKELALWTAAHPAHVLALRKRYFKELNSPTSVSALEKLYALVPRRKQITLLHAGRSAENSAATILKALMEGRRKPPSPSGPAKAAAASGAMRAAKSRRGKR